MGIIIERERKIMEKGKSKKQDVTSNCAERKGGEKSGKGWNDDSNAARDKRLAIWTALLFFGRRCRFAFLPSGVHNGRGIRQLVAPSVNVERGQRATSEKNGSVEKNISSR